MSAAGPMSGLASSLLMTVPLVLVIAANAALKIAGVYENDHLMQALSSMGIALVVTMVDVAVLSLWFQIVDRRRAGRG